MSRKQAPPHPHPQELLELEGGLQRLDGIRQCVCGGGFVLLVPVLVSSR